MFAATLPLLLAYPRVAGPPAAAGCRDAGDRRRRPPRAAALLAARKDDTTLDLARAMLQEAGATAARRWRLRPAGAVTRPSVHARAATRAVELRLATGAIDAKQAADGLDGCCMPGAAISRAALRERLAELQARSGAWRAALALLRETEATVPDTRRRSTPS